MSNLRLSVETNLQVMSEPKDPSSYRAHAEDGHAAQELSGAFALRPLMPSTLGQRKVPNCHREAAAGRPWRSRGARVFVRRPPRSARSEGWERGGLIRCTADPSRA